MIEAMMNNASLDIMHALHHKSSPPAMPLQEMPQGAYEKNVTWQALVHTFKPLHQRTAAVVIYMAPASPTFHQLCSSR